MERVIHILHLFVFYVLIGSVKYKHNFELGTRCSIESKNDYKSSKKRNDFITIISIPKQDSSR